MTFVFFAILTLFLIILQTVILPEFSWYPQCFDLLIIDILFLSLTFTRYSMLVFIVLIGAVMDSVSGAPFCHYIFSYLWIFLIVQLLKRFVFPKSVMFVFIISVVSVLIQHGLVLFSVYVNHGQQGVGAMDFILMLKQVLWGVLVIPPGIWLTNVLWQNWIFIIRYTKKRIEQKVKD
ncbi:MAG: hypothetical protein GY729_17735 [Desulfobacteraceae bacterium]|nr:hypothetical protein [Desulfobacteraceae bacterium]